MVNSRDPDPIRHVVVLILENHSFDQMLGCFKAVFPDLEGIDPAAPGENQDTEGRVYRQVPTTERIMFLDPHHEVPHVRVQLEDGNRGFVRDFETAYNGSSVEARGYVMGYYPLDFLPGLHTLARHFTICDHWFSSLPGPTWPNRFFALTGTSNGRVNMPDDGTHRADLRGYFQQTQDTLFDRLNERAIHWKVYFHDVPQTTVLMHQRQPHNVARYFYIDEFFEDAHGHEREFPQFCLIEPAYIGVAENDNHPPHDVMRAEKLTADVYNAIRANAPLWQSTLLVVLYDEHGGFYDHVEPPDAVAPDDRRDEYTFDRLGVRVPAVLVSPWVDARVEPTVFDHTSLLHYLIAKWDLGPLGRRAAQATSIGIAIQRPAAREDTPSRIELTEAQLNPPDPQLEEEAFGYLSTHQTALAKLTAYLEAEAFEETPLVVSATARALEALKSAAERLLQHLSGVPSGTRASIPEPDRLSANTTADARNNVAHFLMRKKAYAALGIRNRLAEQNLAAGQREYAIQTLALITGRKFHRQKSGNQLALASQWMQRHL